jgi:4-hydroxy-tetrahydrodipicolinate synthase
MKTKPSPSYPGNFRGVFAALVTPMTADDVIDDDKLSELVDHLIGQGVHGLIPLGSTGEYYALSPANANGCFA